MPIEGQNEIGTRAKIVVAEASVSMRHYVSVRLFGWYHFLSIHVSIDFFFPITTPSLIEGKNAIGAGAKIAMAQASASINGKGGFRLC